MGPAYLGSPPRSRTGTATVTEWRSTINLVPIKSSLPRGGSFSFTEQNSSDYAKKHAERLDKGPETGAQQLNAAMRTEA